MIENSRHVKKRNVDNTWFKKEYQVFFVIFRNYYFASQHQQVRTYVSLID